MKQVSVNRDPDVGQGEEEVRVLHPLSYMSGNLKKKMEEVLGCRFLSFLHSDSHHKLLLNYAKGMIVILEFKVPIPTPNGPWRECNA